MFLLFIKNIILCAILTIANTLQHKILRSAYKFLNVFISSNKFINTIEQIKYFKIVCDPIVLILINLMHSIMQ